MPQYIVSACHDGKRIRSDVFEATSMLVAMEHAKHEWPQLAALSWLGEQGEDHPQTVARLLSWPPYVVQYMVRKRDAIGIFYAVAFDVKAPDEAAALQAAFTMAQALGYETREPISVTRKL